MTASRCRLHGHQQRQKYATYDTLKDIYFAEKKILTTLLELAKSRTRATARPRYIGGGNTR
jgi:ferritin-like metal-binding protein YciE